MSTGKLKAQYNRVRTSTALQTTSIWANTIGLQEEQKGSNQAIEASIYAPGGGGRGREAKRQRAQELIEASGYEPSVRDFAGLKALARRQGGDAATNRGACRLCGGLGHLTKQCRNFLDNGAAGAAAGGAAGAAGAAAAGDGDNRQLLTADDDEALLLGSDDSARSSDLGSDSDSSGDERRRKKQKKEKKEKSKKHKKEKSKKHKKEKSSKHRSRDRSRSRSRERTDRDRSRSSSRSPARKR
ncbi:hypothetical protein OEZ85_005798 [Tetradesmus obliquus]|uniref:CCHC-type domain-containing protein n=1 Tax=Tetradesmus obliquus TaxID=3088 RepID=A0ABY8UEV2_TETOB|nr:hypothetical protein OEZ85_005798 [Tetradesmus obliquus]